MCGGNKQQTSKSSTTALPEYSSAYSSLLNQAQNVASAQWNPATGQQVAGFTPTQNQAFDAVQNNQGSYLPSLSAAGASVAAGSSPVSTSSILSAYNPFIESQVAALQGDLAYQNAQTLQASNSNAAKIGALTGDRSQIAAQIAQDANNRNAALATSQLQSNAYGQAANIAQGNQQAALQGATIYGNLANQTQQLGLNDINSLWGAGQSQQQQEQNVLNANTANAQAESAYPFNTTQWLAGLTTALGNAAGSNSSTTTPGPNLWSQIAGLGLGAASLFNRGGRVGYDSGGVVTAPLTAMPYAGARSYVPSVSMGGTSRPSPTPSLGSQTQDTGMSGVLDNFRQAKSAFQGMGNVGSKAFNWANTTTDPTSGWATTTTPSGLSGISNYLTNTFGFAPFADGGAVEHRRGMPGTQSGAVLESPQMQSDRNLQEMLALGLGGLSAAQMVYGNVPALVGGGTASAALDANAGEPNIQDVWMHRFHQWLKPKGYDDGGVVDDVPYGPWDQPSPNGSEHGSWSPIVDPAPSLTAPMGLGAMNAPAPQQSAPSAPVATPYELPQREGLLGLNISDAARQGMLAAGLGMMASRSPFIGTAIGEGGLAGVRSYSDAKQQAVENTQSKTRIDQEAQRLAQQAKESSERLRIAALQEGRAAESFPLEQAQRRQSMEIQNRPDIRVIGQDDFGRSIYGLVDPRTGRPTATVDQDGNLVPASGSSSGASTATPPLDSSGNSEGASPSSDVRPGRAKMTDLVDGIMSGKQPPTLTGLYKNAGPVRAALAQRGFDLSTAQLQWDGANKQIMSMNGPQQVRYYQLANGVVNTIDRVNELSRELKNSGVPLLNKAKLDAYIQLNGNSPQGQLATQYVTAVGVLREEMANLANGGYAPTEPAWALANEQVNGNYGVQQLGASLTELQRLINYRLRALPQANTFGPGAENRYTGATGKQPTHEEIDKAVKASQPESHPSQAADGEPPLARPKSKAEYDALPSGSRYIDPEGNARTKP